ncbi:MAG: hypothetical protein Greene07147_607 [Parcubacteria group bacterium Greene0714_7]|nr:MAG: hypothetical protein Greene07147_607 [Parcubacteria group bacterium Greene0714_7]
MSELQFPDSQTNILILDDSQDEALQLKQFIFHVENGDYFAMLSTLLGFVEETANKLEEKDEAMKIAEMQIARLRHNLQYLHENYNITPKKRPLEAEPKLID